MDSKGTFVRTALITNVILVLLVAPLAWWVGQLPTMLGALVGGLVGILNLFAMSWLLTRMVDGAASTGSKPLYGAMLGGKFLAIVVVIFVAVVVLDLDALGFLMGLSTMVISLFVGGFVHATEGDVSENKESEQT